jgi:hypothetical protein
MMRKSTIFISTVLTTFVLVMLYGLVSAYRGISNVTEASASAIDTATAPPTTQATFTPTILTPEQAAQMAVQVVGNSNLLSAESSSINGVDAYKITFTNNDVVYVGLDGQILGVQVAPVLVNVSAQVPAKREDKNNSGGGESHDDHEEHDD